MTPPITCLEPTNAPRVRPDAGPRVAATRPETLDRAVIGLVSNTLGRSQQLLMALHRELAKDAHDVSALEIVKPHKSVPPTGEQWARLRAHATAALTGFGG